ncbi:F-box/WD repeat-containing protein 2-like isoform X2 [Pomacea canaliculata]|nr:F-box/WD repeat-containing protein 2-like isoform X2 [Pomacea canaliculata]XP_025078250.1 F-box/WD repeat-containing protein 2-like isoform X2 [Pomacea canaliculata]XP_025078252.1 F-box/WD repeat-containing protein 2-like isoform X2 [Pomacea canaliculata]
MYLQEHLQHIFLWNPFIDLDCLPFQKILHVLDVQSLARCRQVCKAWNIAVSSNSRLWWLWCKRDGAQVGDYESKHDYISLYVKLKHVLKKLSLGTFFSWEPIPAPKGVLRIVYKDGIFVFELYGRNSTTCLMDTQSYEVLQELQSDRLSCLTFRDNIIVAGSFLAGMWVWQLGGFVNKQVLQGHAGATICADIHPSKSFVVTGSADKTVILHNLDVGASHHLHVGPIENHVRHVHFLPQNSTEQFRICVGEQSRIVVAVVDKNGHCLAYSQHLASGGGRYCSFSHASHDENLFYVSVMEEAGFCSVISYHLSETDFTEEKAVITGLKSCAHVIGCGRRFLMILYTIPLAETDNSHNFLIFDLTKSQIIARTFIPIRSSENAWTVSVGDTDWLHGLSSDTLCSRKFLIVFVSYDGELCCMSWDQTLWKA